MVDVAQFAWRKRSENAQWSFYQAYAKEPVMLEVSLWRQS